MPEHNLPLSRFKVIDLTRVRAGPTGVKQLADWGADVIKVETPQALNNPDGFTGHRHGFDFQNLHRNKRSLSLNLKTPEGKEILFRLVEDADVLVENYRPAVKHRLGIGYEAIRRVNPRIVYGSISGFGQTGPYADRPGLDQILQGMGGLMSVTGLPGQGPVRVGIPIADLASGIFLAQGILIALLEREVSGEGQWVHTSLLEAQIQMMDFQAARYLKDGEIPGQVGNNHPTGSPTCLYESSDGYINIQAGNQQRWKCLARALGAPELLENPDYAEREGRVKNRDALNEEINKRTRTRTTREWVELLNEAGVPCGPVYTVDQTFADPHIRQLGMDPSVDHPILGTFRLVGQAVNLSRTPQRMRSATPELGEHTEAILTELGYDAEAIAGLRERGVI